MYTFTNSYINQVISEGEWGSFISPDKELENCPNPNDLCKINMPTSIKADFRPYLGLNALFSDIVTRIVTQQNPPPYEDQCSAKYYYDMFNMMSTNTHDFDRIVEVGVYLGGASCILAGSLVRMNKTLDLIDLNAGYLRYTYERIRRLFPEAASRVRLFRGNLPAYVKNVMMQESNLKYVVQHDGSHCFNEVIKDLCSLYFVKDRVNGVLIQDTHLRTVDINLYTFVDAAVYTVFGFAMKFYQLGVKFGSQTTPASRFSTYFLENYPEGMYIPFAANNFRYPHHTAKLESFLATEVSSS